VTVDNTATLATPVWRDYYALTKPNVVALMLLTAWVGMLLASPPDVFPWSAFIFGTLGIGFCAGSAAVINHLVERRIDQQMLRTKNRPVASGRVNPRAALLFALTLGIAGLAILIYFVNAVCAWLTLITLLGYALFYTIYLKRATPQNIVIGGAAGAAPPLLGWSAVSGDISPYSLLLVLIIFTWTPPHFWALAIYRFEDYAKSKLPMLPNTHGIPFTKLCILLYILLLIAATILPYVTGMSGICYLVIALGLGIGFLYYGYRLYLDETPQIARRTFGFSIIYLMVLFLGLILDHYLSSLLHFVRVSL
jgi:protoheme IX farnesyltransferase